MKELIQKYNDKAFGRDLLIYQNKILKLERKYPCDYVARYPKYLRPNPPSDAANNRNNALKNVIMRIIINIRDRRKRPKLSDFIAVYREKKNEKDADAMNVKREFQNKFHMLYGEIQQKENVDRKYENLMKEFGRLQNKLKDQQSFLCEVV